MRNIHRISLALLVITFLVNATANAVGPDDIGQINSTPTEVQDSSQRTWQVSFLPGISSDGRKGRDKHNRLSFNIIGGQIGSLDGFELGLGFNLVKDSVEGVQIAGFGNFVGGEFKGVQLGGFYNANLKNFEGWQAAGFGNFLRGNLKGAQTSGGINYANSIHGAQAGLINIARTKVKGAQIGLLNYTRGLHGTQLGLLNVADTVSGTPIGLLTFIRKGYWHFDVYGDDLTFANFSFRTGVRHFHNIFTAGYGGIGNDKLWRLGYGLGSEFQLGKKKKGFTNLDLTASYLGNGSNDLDRISILTTFNWDVGVRFNKRFALFAGPSIKWYHSELTGNADEPKNLIDPQWREFYNETDNNRLNQVWVGFRGGVRF